MLGPQFLAKIGDISWSICTGNIPNYMYFSVSRGWALTSKGVIELVSFLWIRKFSLSKQTNFGINRACQTASCLFLSPKSCIWDGHTFVYLNIEGVLYAQKIVSSFMLAVLTPNLNNDAQIWKKVVNSLIPQVSAGNSQISWSVSLFLLNLPPCGIGLKRRVCTHKMPIPCLVYGTDPVQEIIQAIYSALCLPDL